MPGKRVPRTLIQKPGGRPQCLIFLISAVCLPPYIFFRHLMLSIKHLLRQENSNKNFKNRENMDTNFDQLHKKYLLAEREAAKLLPEFPGIAQVGQELTWSVKNIGGLISNPAGLSDEAFSFYAGDYVRAFIGAYVVNESGKSPNLSRLTSDLGHTLDMGQDRFMWEVRIPRIQEALDSIETSQGKDTVIATMNLANALQLDTYGMIAKQPQLIHLQSASVWIANMDANPTMWSAARQELADEAFAHRRHALTNLDLVSDLIGALNYLKERNPANSLSEIVSDFKAVAYQKTKSHFVDFIRQASLK